MVPSTELPRYPYLAVDVAPEEAEEAGALLFELGALGVEERDATTLKRGAAGKVTLVASFERTEDVQAASAELPAAWAPRLEEVVGDDWRDEWKKHFEPFEVCRGLVVCPPWRSVEPREGARVVVLEPGRAFGTGLHETTGLVAELLSELPALAGARVLDVGCGSGILSLVALALGAGEALAVDVDPDAVAVTRENAIRNGMEGRLRAAETPAGEIPGAFPIVVANIEAAPLVALAPAIVARVARGGTLILSGILGPEVAPAQLPEIRAAYGALRELEVRARGEWIAVVLEAP